MIRSRSAARPLSNDEAARASRRKLALGGFGAGLLYVLVRQSLRHPGDPFWWLWDIGRFAGEVTGGKVAANSSVLAFLLLLLGMPVLAWQTAALTRRFRRDLLPPGRLPIVVVGLVAAAVLLTFPMALLLVGNPGVALIFGGFLALAALLAAASDGPAIRRRAALVVLAGACWLAYGWYETELTRWSREVSGAIRVDVLLVMPMLVVVTACAAWLLLVRFGDGGDRG